MVKKVAILANGGDVSGFNAVIRAIVKAAEKDGVECYGFVDGYRGLLNNDYIRLSTSQNSRACGILPKGGSIIGSSTNANVFHYKVEENGQVVYKDLSDKCVQNIKDDGFDCLFTLGGDGTQKSARDFSLKGINVIGVPKTIDNDVACTDITFGYNTAVSVASDALDRLHTTGETHHRLMVLEVMGRYAGWIALESAISGGADIALIPEIPYDINKVVEKINQRRALGKNFSIIVVAEGAKPKGGEISVAEMRDNGKGVDNTKLGGAGEKVTSSVEATLLWMDDDKLESGKNYFVKLGTRLVPGIVSKILYSIDVNTGEQKPADSLGKNEIAECEITFVDRVVADEFSKHKTLGELILIDRVTNMTSACGVVTEVKEDGQEAGKKADQLRAVIKGQRAATIPFDLSDENITRSFVEQVEKELTLGGRHTYLYAPKDDEPVGLVVRHLNRAGIIVLLVLNKDLKNKEEIKGSLAKYSKYIKHWEEGEKGDVDSTVQTIRKLTEYAEDVYGVASHI